MWLQCLCLCHCLQLPWQQVGLASLAHADEKLTVGTIQQPPLPTSLLPPPPPVHHNSKKREILVIVRIWNRFIKSLYMCLDPWWSLIAFDAGGLRHFVFSRIRLGLAVNTGQLLVLWNSFCLSCLWLKTDVFFNIVLDFFLFAIKSVS